MNDPTIEELAKAVVKGTLGKRFNNLLNKLVSDNALLENSDEDTHKFITLIICSLFNLTYKDNNTFVKYAFKIIQDHRYSTFHLPACFGILSYCTSYKNNDILAVNKDLKQKIESWSSYPEFVDKKIVSEDMMINFFDNANRQELSCDEMNQLLKFIKSNIGSDVIYLHLIVVFVKSFGPRQPHHFEISKMLMFEAFSLYAGFLPNVKGISRIVLSFMKKFSSTPCIFMDVQNVIPEIAKKLLNHCKDIKDVDIVEIHIHTYCNLISNSNNEMRKRIVSDEFINLSLNICLNLCNRIKSESGSTDEEKSEDQTDFNDTLEDGEEGTIENLFESETVPELGCKILKMAKKILSYISQQSNMPISFENLKLIMKIAIDVETIQGLDLFIGVRSNSNLMAIKSYCKIILFPSIIHLGVDQMLQLVDAGEKALNFTNDFELVALSRYVYYSIQQNKTDWFQEFILKQIGLISSSETITGNNVNFAIIIFLIMIDSNTDVSTLVSGLFLNLCSAATLSTQNTIQLLVLFDHLISQKPKDYKKKLFVKLEQCLNNEIEHENFVEIKNLPVQKITALLYPENMPRDDNIVNNLIHEFESIGEMFCQIVESIINKTCEDSRNIIILIILAKRIIKKLDITTQSKIVQLVCEDKIFDDVERVKFLMQYTETCIQNASSNKTVDLLLLVTTLAEMTAAGSNIPENVRAFILTNFSKLLKMCEKVLLDDMAINEHFPTKIVRLFLPFGAVTSNIECLRYVQESDAKKQYFKTEYLLQPGANGSAIFSILAEHPNDKFEYIYIYNILNILSKAIGVVTDEMREVYKEAFAEADVIFKSSQAFIRNAEQFADFTQVFANSEPDYCIVSRRLANSITNFNDMALEDSFHIALAMSGFGNIFEAYDVCMDKLELSSVKIVIKFLLCNPSHFANIFELNLLKSSEFLEIHQDTIFDDDMISLLLSATMSWCTLVATEPSETCPESRIADAKKIVATLPRSILSKVIFKVGLDNLNKAMENESFIFFNLMVKLANSIKDKELSPHASLTRWSKEKIKSMLTNETAQALRDNKKFHTLIVYIIRVARSCDLAERQIPTELLDRSGESNEEMDTKLCTYTTTRRDFQNQHWYHCYTCEMYDSVGICTTCALVCHKGHSMSYAKYSSFFCDCGAENEESERGMCQALTPRTRNVKTNEKSKLDIIIRSNDDLQQCTDLVTDLADPLHSSIKTIIDKNALPGEKDQGFRKAKELLTSYKTEPKRLTYYDYVRAEFQTNEGALANVKPSFTGDTAIRKILTENAIQRKYIGLISHGNEMYLIILHDKSRLSLLGLSSLLSKKSRSSQMAISKQSSTNLSIPVTSLAVSDESSNIAVCSLRNVTIVMIKNGSFGRQLSLNLNLPTADFITSIVWLPKSSTCLAVVTDKNIKIYDFMKDHISPIYNFKVLVGSFVDATFMFQNNMLYLLAMTNEGCIFFELIGKSCAAEEHGEVYLTNELDLAPIATLSVTGHGICIHYSLPTETLFLTILTEQNGYRSYCYSNVYITDNSCFASNGLYLKPSALRTTPAAPSTGKQISRKFKAALKKNLEEEPPAEKKICYMRNFTDVKEHPGIVTANFGSHIAIIIAQQTCINLEILQDKRSVLDLVGTCHNFRSEAKVQTSLLAVSEDGALRGWILTGDKEEETHIWRNIMIENNQVKQVQISNEEDYNFPINFFERCTAIPEVEFSSPQLARIYNKHQLKQRLAPSNSISQSQYVAWRGGFYIQIKSFYAGLIRGVRIHVGQNGHDVVPPSVTFGSRQFQFVDINRAKWVDIVFTAREAIEFDGKINLMFAPSNHQDQRVIIEAIKVFGQPRQEVEAELNEQITQSARNKIHRVGPLSSDDVFDSKLVECYALCSNLITKAQKRSSYLEEMWKYLDHEHAALESLQSCASLLPSNVCFSQKRDILVVDSFDTGAKYDWSSLSIIVSTIYSVGKYRTSTFRLHMTSQKCLQFYEKLVSEFGRLRDDENANKNRSVIFPRCANYRAISHQLVYILCLTALISPTERQFEPIRRFLNQTADLIDLGARDAIFDAVLASEKLEKLSSKLSLSFSANENHDEIEENVEIKESSNDENGSGMFEDEELEPEDDEEEDSDDDDDEEDDEEDEDCYSAPTEEDLIEHLQNENDSVVVQLSDMNAFSSLLNIPDLSEESLQQMMEIDNNPASLVDFAFALARSQRTTRQRTHTSEANSQPNTNQNQVTADTETQECTTVAEVDVIFSAERLRVFRIEIAKMLIRTNQSLSIAQNQLLIHTASQLNLNDADESLVLESISDFLVKCIQDEIKNEEYLSLLTLNHIMHSSEKIGKHIADFVGCQINPIIIGLAMENCTSFANYVEVDVHTDNKISATPDELLTRDFYPFSENNMNLLKGDKLLLFISGLQYLELVKQNGCNDLSSGLVNAIFGLLVCDTLPPGLRHFSRKLALAMVSSPDKYRSRRDQQKLTKYLESIEKIHRDTTECSYNDIAEIFENFKSIIEIAKRRIISWQKFAENEKWIAELLLNLSLKVECCNKEILQLIEMAITPQSEKNKQRRISESESITTKKKRKDTFVDNLIGHGDGVELANLKFLKFFLFSDDENVRWAAHNLLKVIFTEASIEKRDILIKKLWNLFVLSTSYGKRAVQYTDLLGYFTIKGDLKDTLVEQYGTLVADTLDKQLHSLATHSNAALYSRLSEQLSFGGFYVESEPCMACNTQKETYTSSRLSTAKRDCCKFTTRAQVYKLASGQEIEQINLKITDSKRSKQINSVTIYYTSRTSVPIIELKNKLDFWLKAKSIDLAPNQTEVSINFSVPIKATFIITEFGIDESAMLPETLTCPRCSNTVQSNPGICNNCGENVFQCVKCRHINYDERDPYLCVECGHSRYAKFEWTIVSRPCTTADPVDNEEERRRAEVEVKKFLEKSDAAWKKLNEQRNELEKELEKIQFSEDRSDETSPKAAALAHKYSECKSSFNEIITTVRNLIANRMELLEYEKRTNVELGHKSNQNSDVLFSNKFSNCYGCAVNGAENAILLLRALSTLPSVRSSLIDSNMVFKLLDAPLSLGSAKLRSLIRRALCRLVRGSEKASAQLGDELRQRIIHTAVQNQRNPQLAGLVRNDLELLKETLKYKDVGWETRLKAALAVFMEASSLCKDENRGVSIVNGVLLPCLEIIQQQSNVGEGSSDCIGNLVGMPINYNSWQTGEPQHQLSQWLQNKNSKKKEVIIIKKYFDQWKEKTPKLQKKIREVSPESFWLPRLLFCKWSQAARVHVCAVMLGLSLSRRNDIFRLMTMYLEHVEAAGESATEFLELYAVLASNIKPDDALTNYILSILGNMLSKSISDLESLEIEISVANCQSSADMRLGMSLEKVVKILKILVKNQPNGKHGLVQPILRGYLSICRLVLLRTKAIEDAQSGLLELLELLTSGSEEETSDFIRTCFDTISHFPINDLQTPQFIFERLCSVIKPDDTGDKNFKLQLDKDQQQEEFLQGRMLHNPYLASTVGIVMRDVKNKICRDTELHAFLEEDNMMDLLVDGKIIHLDLKISDVYNKIWLAKHEKNVPMRVVYRMRGLMGEATEEFIEKFNDDNFDDEEVYKRARFILASNGFQTIMERLSCIKKLSSKSRPLLDSALLLLCYCSKLQVCREALVGRNVGFLSKMLQMLNMCIAAEEALLVEDILNIINRVLGEGALNNQEMDTGDKEELTSLLNAIDSEFVQSRPAVIHSLMEMIPFLSFGDEQLMEQLINHFHSVLDELKSYDDASSDQHKVYLESFCDIVKGLKPDNPGGRHLKDIMYKRGLPQQAIEYLRKNTLPDKNYDDGNWKDLLAKPVLPFVLRIIAGLCRGHADIQKLVGESCVPELHRLEQVSAEGNIGTLAEECLEALRDNKVVFKRVSEARRATTAEKRKAAMEKRNKDLETLGMTTNEKGQLKIKSNYLSDMEDLNEEKGPVCVICREGYRFEPTKLLEIYIFAKRSTVESYETASRKTVGFETVSHFNFVHRECHQSAIRYNKSRKEWESATLQNTNTRCNSMLPCWGLQVSESVYASAHARFTETIREATGGVTSDVDWLMHDIKLLLVRFASEQKFHLDSGGGGPESNLKLIPYLIQSTLYVLNQTKQYTTYSELIDNIINKPDIQHAYAVQGPLFATVACILVHDHEKWKAIRFKVLRSLILMSHVRKISLNPKSAFSESERLPMSYEKYQSSFIFWFIVDRFYQNLYPSSELDMLNSNLNYSEKLQLYIRSSEIKLMEKNKTLVTKLQQDVYEIDDFDNFREVAGIVDDTDSRFITKTLEELPTA